MANFYTGGVDTFNALVYNEPHPNTIAFMENMLAQPTAALTGAGEQFRQRARDAYERFNGSDAMRLARAAARQVTSQWDRNIIRPLNTIAELQQAPLVMQRYLMAEPTTRRMYHKQQCDGYSQSYVDAAPGVVGEEHHEYRRVMNGLVEEDEDGTSYWVEYVDELEDGEVEFDSDRQFDIKRSWVAQAAAMMAGGDDPTSVWNAEL